MKNENNLSLSTNNNMKTLKNSKLLNTYEDDDL